MLLQKGMNHRKSNESRSAGNQLNAGKERIWREICEEVLKERETEKVDALLEDLAQALDRRAREHDQREGTRPPKP